MFVLRSVFWFALVALMIPRGPDLGIDVRQSAGLPVTQFEFRSTATQLLRDVADVRLTTDDPVETFRRAAFHQLAIVRMEIAADRARRGTRAGLSAIIPEAWRD